MFSCNSAVAVHKLLICCGSMPSNSAKASFDADYQVSPQEHGSKFAVEMEARRCTVSIRKNNNCQIATSPPEAMCFVLRHLRSNRDLDAKWIRLHSRKQADGRAKHYVSGVPRARTHIVNDSTSIVRSEISRINTLLYTLNLFASSIWQNSRHRHTSCTPTVPDTASRSPIAVYICREQKPEFIKFFST